MSGENKIKKIDLAYLDLLAGNPMAVFRLVFRLSEGSAYSEDKSQQYTYFRHFATCAEIGVQMGSNQVLYQGIGALNSMTENNPFAFTEQELGYISEEATRMLKELEQQRMDMGWGPYPDAKEMRDSYHAYLKQDLAEVQSMTNWGRKYQQ